MSPQVSVVVPTHNRSELLRLTLRSILCQQDVDFEVIVVDEGSSDATQALVRPLASRRVRLVRHDVPLGVSAARNRGIDEATGEWVAFCDDDDLWAPEKLTKQLREAALTGRAWACTGHVDVNSTLRVVGGTPPPSAAELVRLLRFRNVVPGGGSGVIVRRATLELVGGFDSRLHNTEDWDLWLRLAAQGPPALVAEPLVAYRLHTGGASLNDRVMLEDVKLIERTHGIRASRAALYRYLGWWALRVGRRRSAFAYFIRGLRDRDDLYSAGDAMADLAYLLRDSVIIAATRGRRRARPRGREAAAVKEWRRAAQDWLDRFSESMDGSSLLVGTAQTQAAPRSSSAAGH